MGRRLCALTGWLLGLAIGLLALASITAPLFAAPALRRYDDFGILWGSAYLHRSGGNPYSPLALNHILQAIGHAPVAEDAAALMWYAPYALAGLLPFTLLSYSNARALWFWLSMISLTASFTWIWKSYMGALSKPWIAWGLGFFFFPTMMMLAKGQIGWLILLGLVGLAAALERRSPIGAGLALLPLLLKPHLVYLVLLIFLFWAWRSHLWLSLAIFALGLGAATAFAWLLNPHILANYLDALRHYAPLGWATPTTGSLLRILLLILLRSDQAILSFLPAIPGAIWATRRWLTHRERWSWIEELPRLTLISILTAPYGWSFDWVLLIWPLLQISAKLAQARTKLLIVFVLGYVLIDLLGFLTYIFVPYALGDFAQIWMPWILFLGYLLLAPHATPGHPNT
ncbi:glycosyltransferase 87 family protein [Thermoflexus sp.]|uniref:glycosyltransferase 87 family protein n=1 Tax=Thermoflexus sp. TaxID=1969742 RepID=UPI0035E42D88